MVKPRIAVLALNPHAGDGGLLGREEEETIRPAVNDAYAAGVLAFGPFAADGFFASGNYAHYDAVLAMYHDQGLAPFKTLTPDGVNYTAGLCEVRTSPDHGVAYDIAGRDKADPQSMRNAIYAALDIVENRRRWAAMSVDPLQHFERDRGRDASAKDLPEMRRHGYDDKLAIGTLACSGGIGSLIPPSSNFIIYGVLAEQSIADLFIAGVFPGLVCMACFIVVIMIMVWRNPELAPALPRVPMHERLVSLKTGLPIIIIFIVVIYAGMFTATEGGGIGAFTTVFLALVMGRLSWSIVTSGLNDTGKTISMAFTVLGGAGVFSYFMTMSKIPMILAGVIASMNMPPMAVMFAIIVCMSLLGCFIPAIPLMLICVPIFGSASSSISS